MASEKLYKVQARNKDFSGVREGVRFEKGVGLANREQAANLMRRGYKCPQLQDAPQKEAPPQAPADPAAPPQAPAGKGKKG